MFLNSLADFVLIVMLQCTKLSHIPWPTYYYSSCLGDATSAENNYDHFNSIVGVSIERNSPCLCLLTELKTTPGQSTTCALRVSYLVMFVL